MAVILLVLSTLLLLFCYILTRREDKMETTNYSVTVGTVTYTDFPTYAEINRFRPDVIRELVVFFRMVGLCSTQQISRAIDSPETDNKVRFLLNRIGADDVDESFAEENIAFTENELQRKILGKDKTAYTVKVSDLVKRMHKMSSLTPKKALTELLHELQLAAKTEKRGHRNIKKTKEPEEEKIEKNKETEEKKMNNFDKVTKIISECPIAPNRDFRAVRKSKEYLTSLSEYFPHVSASMIAQYLFDDNIKLATVNGMFHAARISRGKVPTNRPNSDITLERIAFVAWTGHDWQHFINPDDSLTDPIKREAKVVKEPKQPVRLSIEFAAEEPIESAAEAPVEPPVEKYVEPPTEAPTEPLENPTPASETPTENTSLACAPPLYLAELKIAGQNDAILRLIDQISHNASIDLLAYHVAK